MRLVDKEFGGVVFEGRGVKSLFSAVCCWSTVVSSSSSSEEKKSDGWFRGVLGGDSGWEGSRQLGRFEVEMVTVRESTMPIGKLDLLLRLVLGEGQA